MGYVVPQMGGYDPWRSHGPTKVRTHENLELKNRIWGYFGHFWNFEAKKAPNATAYSSENNQI